jgi:hypothetical protein
MGKLASYLPWLTALATGLISLLAFLRADYFASVGYVFLMYLVIINRRHPARVWISLLMLVWLAISIIFFL